MQLKDLHGKLVLFKFSDDIRRVCALSDLYR